jgi:hypothetical protein
MKKKINMKLYTDLEQSVKLAEVLPLDSADMYWSRCTITDFGDGKLKVSYSVEPCNISQTKHTKDDIPCWSLGRLFELIQINSRIEKTMLDQSGIFLYDISTEDNDFRTHTQEELIDACIEFILELEKRDLLF